MPALALIKTDIYDQGLRLEVQSMSSICLFYEVDSW